MIRPSKPGIAKVRRSRAVSPADASRVRDVARSALAAYRSRHGLPSNDDDEGPRGSVAARELAGEADR